MDPAKKAGLRAIKILRGEMQLHPPKRIEMSRETFDRLQEATKTDLFDLSEDKIDGDIGSLDGVPIRENNAIPHGKARIF